MENTLPNPGNNESGSLLHDEHDDFIPIDTEWRKKYYKKAFGKRVVAFIIDYFIVNIGVGVPLQLIFHEGTDEAILKWFMLYSFLYFFIFAIMESSKWKGTFGKRIMKIEVSDDYNNAISFWRSIGRNLLKCIAIYSYVLILPLIIQIFTYRKSGKLFHDYFSKTIIGERIYR